jgi:GTPase
MSLAEKILKGDEKSAARLITLLENRKPDGYKELTKLLPHTGKAHVLGITGPAGAGKSTIISKLAGRICLQGKKVGIIAIDPTSVQSRGSFMGDRVRMSEIEGSEEVFIRSMADREHPGGINRAALGAVYVMEALGKNIVMVESVGAGQSDKGLFSICDTVVTLFTPEFGDELQLLKAGLLEIGDIVVVNKRDKPGAKNAVSTVHSCIRGQPKEGWIVPVHCTRADTGEGMDDFMAAVETRWKFLEIDSESFAKWRQKMELFTKTLLKEEIWQRFLVTCAKETEFKRIMDTVQSKMIDPYSAVEQIADVVEARLQNEQPGDLPSTCPHKI